MKDLVRNKPANFQLFILRFYEVINKTVIPDGGRTADAILNISVISKATFTKI